MAVNVATNTIYVVNICGNDPTCGTFNETVTVIDGVTLSTSTVTLAAGFDAGFFYLPGALAVNPVTNKIYVVAPCGSDHTCQSNGTVTVIDANNNNMTTTITVGLDPQSVAVNPATNNIGSKLWLDLRHQLGSNTVTVIDGKNNSVAGNPARRWGLPLWSCDQRSNQPVFTWRIASALQRCNSRAPTPGR